MQQNPAARHRSAYRPAEPGEGILSSRDRKWERKRAAAEASRRERRRREEERNLMNPWDFEAREPLHASVLFPMAEHGLRP